jgi:hypothetical protein
MPGDNAAGDVKDGGGRGDAAAPDPRLGKECTTDRDGVAEPMSDDTAEEA